MQERHQNRKLYFDEQCYTTEKYVIPYINKYKNIDENCRILEIGCGEGGNLKPFLDKNCTCVGVDINSVQIKNAIDFFATHPHKEKIEFIDSDIYEINRDDFTFDIIMLRDVIEHIHNQERFMTFVQQFFEADGVIFFAFPPWYMPFGGHQQICQSKLSKCPYFHLLPKKLYASLLKKMGETEQGIKDLLEIKETGITIERFERIVCKNNFLILDKCFYFINPNYEIKFKLRPRKSLPFFSQDSIFKRFLYNSSILCYY